MLTDRGRWILAFGGLTYLVAWGFGSEPLYPVAVGLVLAVAGAALWVRLLRKPMTLRRSLGRGDHTAGDDVPVQLELEVQGSFPTGSLVVTERIARIGARETVLTRHGGRLRGRYVLHDVPRGRYPIESAEVVIEDPFGLERIEVPLPRRESLLVYPRLVDLESLFSDAGARTPGGRRLLMRRTTGFELHSVREYEQGESLRRVHWPSTARRGQLMVKELEDAPRDETAVLLDADASAVGGGSFDMQVRAAGSIMDAYVRRGRRAVLVVNSDQREVQHVHSPAADWSRALELLASVEPTGRTSAPRMLAEDDGPAVRAL